MARFELNQSILDDTAWDVVRLIYACTPVFMLVMCDAGLVSKCNLNQLVFRKNWPQQWRSPFLEYAGTCPQEYPC